MSANNRKCLATLKNGKPCRNSGRSEFNGYCGLHKAVSLAKSAPIGKGRDKRLVELLTVGVALIEITSKAIEYLPDLIEVLVNASHVGFCDAESGGAVNDMEPVKVDEALVPNDMEKAGVPFLYRPKTLSNDIAEVLEHQDWQRMANMLAYDFDVKINSGSIPEPLKTAIRAKKSELMAALKELGYEPGLHTVDRPVFLRSLDG